MPHQTGPFKNSKNIPWLAAVNHFVDDPYDAVGSFGIQQSFFAALFSPIQSIGIKISGL
jgi:hypothetical protein